MLAERFRCTTPATLSRHLLRLRFVEEGEVRFAGAGDGG
jgi:hypothetical protein